MEIYTIEKGIMKENLKDYEFRQAIKYAFWWAVGLLSASVLHGLAQMPWVGMGMIAVGILVVCWWVGKKN